MSKSHDKSRHRNKAKGGFMVALDFSRVCSGLGAFIGSSQRRPEHLSYNEAGGVAQRENTYNCANRGADADAGDAEDVEGESHESHQKLQTLYAPKPSPEKGQAPEKKKKNPEISPPTMFFP